MKKNFILAAITATSLSTVALAQPFDANGTNSSGYSSRTAHQIPTMDTNVETQTQGDVSFITGGIGDDERAAIEAQRGSYNLHVMSASTNGAFISDSQVTVVNKSGATVLDTNAGPLLYAKLPAGTYSLTATHGDETRHQKFTVGKKSAVVHLSWKVAAVTTDEPTGTGTDY